MSGKKVQESSVLNLAEYRDKVLGCWLGKNIGGTLGAPLEGKQDFFEVTGYLQDLDGKPAPNDDLDLQLVWLDAVENHGVYNLNPGVMGECWVNHIIAGWNEYGVCRANILNGFYPPLSGALNNERWYRSNGAWIRSEIWACLFPGSPDEAARFAVLDASCDHCGDGVYAEIFTAVLESAAFFESDLCKLIELGLSRIPSDSRVAGSVRLACRLFDEGKSLREARDEIVRANADLGWFQAPGNLGFTVLGLLYGGGDFGKTLCYAVNCGDDTDCTAATAGSILGIMYGAKNIPEQWIAPIGRTIQTVAINRFELPVPGTIDELTDRVVNEALRAAQENPLLVQFSETESSVLTAADAAALATPQALEIDQWAQEFNFPWGTFTVTGEEWPLLESGVARRLKVEISHTTYVNEVVSIKPLLPEGWSATPAGVVFTPSRRTFVASAELEITPGEIDDALIYIPFEIRLAGRANPFMTAVPFQQRGAVSGNNMSRLCRARSRQLRRHQARCCR